MPTVVSEGQRANGCQDGTASGDRLGLQSACRIAPHQSADSDEEQRHQLNKSGSILEIAASFCSPGVKGKAEHNPHRTDGALT